MRIILPLVLFILLFNVATTLYIYYTLLRRLHWAVRLFYVLINLGFLVTFGSIMRGLLTGADSLISPNDLTFFTFYYFLFYTPQLVYTLFDLLTRALRDRTRVLTGIGAILASAVAVTMAWGHFYETTNLTVEEYEISSANLPESFDGYRIVQFSDLHISSFHGDSAFIRRLANEINALNPDLVLFTGDLVTVNSKEAEIYLKPLSSIHAPDGVYAVLGNHDYSEYARWPSEAAKAADFQNLKNEISAVGWRLMLDECVSIRRGVDSILLAGIENWGEPPFSAKGDLNRTFAQIQPRADDFTILLSHNPEFWRRIVVPENHPIDLTLAGHTHALQMMFKFQGVNYSPSTFKYTTWGGLYQEGQHQLIVNRGIGSVFYHMRIGASPEISLIQLKSR